MAYILIQTTAAPYSTSLGIDALEAAFAATNIGLRVKFVFIDDGIYQLLNHQQSQAIGHKSLAKKLSALPLFDIEDIYVCAHSARERQIDLTDNLLVNSLSVCVVDNQEMKGLLDHADHILVF
jgi:tRNA 2-thiouridine synthesizing protein C